MIDRRKLLGSILGTVLFVVVILAFTYAYYTWKSEETLLTLNISDISDDANNTVCESGVPNNISGLGPVLDYRDGAFLTFSVNNSEGTSNTSFSLSLNITSIDEALLSKSFKYKLMKDETGSNNCADINSNDCTNTDDEGNVLEEWEGDFSNFKVGMNTLISSIQIPAGKTYQYYLFIYIDGTMENDINMINKSMTSTLEICEVIALLNCNGGICSKDHLVLSGNNYSGLPVEADYTSTVTYNTNGGTLVDKESNTDTASYTFGGWFADEKLQTEVTESTKVTKTTNHTLYAKWTSTAPIILPSATKEGYTLAGWYSNENFSSKSLAGNAGDTYIASSENVTLYARWNANTYTVSFEYNGGTGDITSSYITLNEKYGELPTPTKASTEITYNTNGGTLLANVVDSEIKWNFDGWYKDSDFNTIVTSSTIVTDPQSHTLYAKWSNSEITLPSATKVGYTFSGWYKDEACTEKIANAGDKYTSTTNMTLYAGWIPNTYTVSFEYNGGTGDITSKDVTMDGTYGELPSPTKTSTEITYNTNGGTLETSADSNVGWNFDGWYKESTFNTPITSETQVTDANDHTLYAKWSIVGAILPSATKEGYTFSGWYSDEACTKKVGDAGSTYTDSNVTLYAGWTANTYTVSYYNAGVPTVELKAKIYGSSETLTSWSDLGFTVTNSTYGWTFAGWSTNYNSYDIAYHDGDSIHDLLAEGSGELSLYAVYQRTVTFYDGINASTSTTRPQFYVPWNNLVSMVIAPRVVTTIDNWMAVGFQANESTTSQISLGDSVFISAEINATYYATYERTLYFYSGVSQATLDGTATQYYNSSGSVSEVTTYTPTEISGFTALGYNNDTTASAPEYGIQVSISPEVTTDNYFYAVYSREATFYSGVSNASSTTATQYYNTTGVYSVTTPSTASMTAITSWTRSGWRDDTTAEAMEFTAGGTSSSSSSKFYAIYYRYLYVYYNGNGYTSGSTSSTTKTIYLNTNSTTTSSKTVTLRSNGFANTNATSFYKWGTTSSYSTATKYSEGDSYTPSLSYNASSFSKTLYAIWEYTITYDANGGSDAPSAFTKYHGQSVTLSTTEPTRSGYLFLGWSTDSTATTPTYEPGSTYTTNASTTLYAVWESVTYLSEVSAGSYVSFVGTNGCTKYSCVGRNANYVSETNMGYCKNSSYKFNVNGWRVAYSSNGNAYLISAGSPECVETVVTSTSYTVTESTTTTTLTYDEDYYYGSSYEINTSGKFVLGGAENYYDIEKEGGDISEDTPLYTCNSATTICTTLYKIIESDGSSTFEAYKLEPVSTTTSAAESTAGLPQHLANLNTAAGKYCNPDYIDGGTCTNGTNVWPMNATDYKTITGSTLSTSSCYNTSTSSCGLNNSLIDNGGFYWFAKLWSSSSTFMFAWAPDNKLVYAYKSNETMGVRPVLKLDSSVFVVGGTGTYDDPYRIATSDNRIPDVSGNGNHGINRGATWDKSAGTLTTNGSSTFVDAGLANYDFGDSATLVARVKFNSIKSGAYILGNWESGGMGIALSSTGTLYVNAYKNGAYITHNTDYTPTTDTWYTIVATYDDGSLSLYINGTYYENSNGSTSGDIGVSKTAFAIGGNINAYGTITDTYSTAGTFDDVLIFDRALTASEISSYYSGTITVSDDTDLLLHYDFEGI